MDLPLWQLHPGILPRRTFLRLRLLRRLLLGLLVLFAALVPGRSVLAHGGPAVEAAALLDHQGYGGHVPLHVAGPLQAQAVLGPDVALYGAGDVDRLRVDGAVFIKVQMN